MRDEAGSADQSSITRVKRMLVWIAGAVGIAALVRHFKQRSAPAPAAADPADDLKRKLEEAREAADDRDEFDAAEGQPVDEVEPARSVAERRADVHEQARDALAEMKDAPEE